MTDPLDTLRPEVREVLGRLRKLVLRCEPALDPGLATIRAELLRLADENARLNKIESLATEQRLQMEDVELYLMDVSQPDDEDAPWCDRMKSAIELLVQDCNDAVGQKNKAESELAALKARIAEAPITQVTRMAAIGGGGYEWAGCRVPDAWNGKRVRLVVEE